MYTKPKKSLGQHFLIDQNIQRKIIASCEFKKSDVVLEIGAGRGELTGLIGQRVNKLYALEIDSQLSVLLKAHLKGYKNIKIKNLDILNFDLRRNFKNLEAKIKIVGNIPYYITTPILGRLLKFRDKINSIFITVQKEFAKRMVALAGSKDYGSFSCFIQYYSEPKILFLIKKSCFFPKPQVDSCFLRLNIREKPIVETNEKLLFKIIRAAFNQRRKTLRNSLKAIIPAKKLELFCKIYNLSPNIRPEELSLKEFANLTNLIKS